MSKSPEFDQQYHALRSGCAAVELRNWSSITLTGKDRQTFLHNFCTNDVQSLVSGDNCEAFITNAKGRTIGHGLIHCRDNELVFVGVPEQAPKLIEHFDRYIIREDVQLRDTTAERKYLYLSPAASGEEVLANCTIVAHSSIADDDRIVELPSNSYDEELNTLQERGYALIDWDVFTALRIESGTPHFGIDFDKNNFPQEVDRDARAISFKKGCYLGQETVARIDALGHVNQKIVGLRFDGPGIPEAGTEVTYSGKAVGKVTSAAYSPRLGMPLALAMIRREANAAGTRLQTSIGDCEVVALPV